MMVSGMELPIYYPVNEFGPLMKGMVIGGLGIFHVFLAQFAIGGGLLMCYFQYLTQTGGEPAARKFLDGFFRALILVSFIVGALTGVGMWFTAIQVSPQTIGLMVDEFHWIWAIEWTFFCVEIVAGYTFYRYGSRLGDRDRMLLLVLYSIASWASLFWINGILSWQLTPGGWTETHGVWAGFFNPSFWPSLFYRTAASCVIAGLAACVVINLMREFSQDERGRLIRRASMFMLPIVATPVLGVWFLQVMPSESREWVMGGSVAMTMFMGIAVLSSFLLGMYVLVGLVIQRLNINGATATLLLALAFGATGGGEFVREGVRKPYTVRGALYSNAITPSEVATLRRVGSVTNDPYPLRDEEMYPNEQVRLGVKVYRAQCSVCHTVNGANGLLHLTGSWTLTQKRMNIAKLQYTKSFMPPFAGSAVELEALVQFLTWNNAGRPRAWGTENDAKVIARIQSWLDEAGTGAARRSAETDDGDDGR